MKLSPRESDFENESQPWLPIKTTRTKKYPDEFYEFHPTGKLTNPVNQIEQKLAVRNTHKTRLDLKKKVVLRRINPFQKPGSHTRNKVSPDNLTSLIDFFLPTSRDRHERERLGRRSEDSDTARQQVKPGLGSKGIKKKQLIMKQKQLKKVGKPSADLLALKIVKPSKVKKKEKQKQRENLREKGEAKNYQDVRNKELAVSKKTIKFNKDGDTRPSDGPKKKTEILPSENKTEIRKSKIYQENKSTQHLLSINQKRTKTHQVSNGLQKSMLKKKGVLTHQQNPLKPNLNRESVEKSSEAVFEFETTVSVSLDSGGYLMTIILISQIIVFGMFLYSRTLKEHQDEADN